MTRITHLAAFTLVSLFLVGSTVADTVITMPLPPGFNAQPVSAAGVSAMAASLTAQLTIEATGTSSAQAGTDSTLLQEGVDALERYAAREGRTRNHYLPGGYVTNSHFRAGAIGPYYMSYQGPVGWGGWGGWGWWGSPIIVNNYCPTFHGGYGGGDGIGSTACRSSFVGIGF